MVGWDRRTILRGIASAGLGNHLVDRTGVSSLGTAAASQGGPTELWTHDLSGEDSAGGAPTVVGDTVFVGDRSLHAIDATDGAERWRTDFGGGAAFGGLESPPIDLSPAPCVVDGTIYAVSGAGLHAVDPSDGTVRWTFEGDGQLTTSPTVVGGTAYVGDGADALHAVDASTGDSEWTFETNGPVSTAPCVAADTVFLASEGRRLYAVDADSGSKLWSHGTRRTVYAAPTYADGVLYVPDYASLRAFDPSTGDVLWSVWIGGQPHRCSTAADGRVFATTRQSLFAIDVEEESVAWDTNLGVDGCVCLSPTVVGDAVVVAKGSHLAGVDAASGDVRWTHSPGGIHGSPTVSDGVVYASIRTDGTEGVVALDADLSGSSAGSRSRLRTLGHASDGSGSEPSASGPEVKPRGIFPNPYPVPADESVDVYAVVEDADEVSVSATFEYESGDETLSREMRQVGDLPQRLLDRFVDLSGEIYVTDDPLPPLEEAGAWADLTVEASDDDGNRASVGRYEEAIPNATDSIGYYGFEHVLSTFVVEARLSDQAPWSDEELAALDEWERDLELGVNRYFGSSRGTIGQIGFDLTFDRASDGLYEVANREDYEGVVPFTRRDDVEFLKWFVSDARSKSDVDTDSYDVVVGSHPGEGITVDGLDIPGERLYISGLGSEDFSLWCHEFGHVFGFTDYYNSGLNRGICLMGRGHLGPRHPFVPPVSTASKLLETLDLLQGSNYSARPVRDDILEPNETALSAFDERATISVPRLDSFGHDQPVEYLRVRRQVNADTVYIAEFQRNLTQVNGGEDALLRRDLDDADGAVVIYRLGVPFRGSGSISLVTDVGTTCLQSAGDQVTDKIGFVDPAEVRLELSSLTDEADVTIERDPGREETVTISLDGSVDVPTAVEPPTASSGGIDARPAVHLRVTDEEGRVTGVTDDGSFVNEIPDARTSGKRPGGVEWINVPGDRSVTTSATAASVDRYVEVQRERGVLGDHDGAAMTAAEFRSRVEIDVLVTETRYGSDPQLVETGVGQWVEDTMVQVDRPAIDPGASVSVEPGPDDGSLALVGIDPGSSVDDERFVLETLTDESLAIGGWTIENADGDEATIPDGARVPADGTRTVTSGRAPSGSDAISLDRSELLLRDTAGRLTFRDADGEVRLDVGYDVRGVVDYDPDAAEGFTAAPGRADSGGSDGLLSSLSLTEIGAAGALGTAGAYLGAKRFRSDH